MRVLSRLAPVCALLFLLAAGCDTIVQEEARPPTLIPAQAFTVETELFEQELSTKTEIGTHAMIARLRVWPVTTALAGYLALPAAVTQAALDEKPAVENGAWVWKAKVATAQQKVAFTLAGTVHEGHVDWTMRVAPAEPDTDSTVVLYTAKTAPDGSSGAWKLFAPTEDTTRHVLDAAFEIDQDGKKKTITFWVPPTASEHAGDAVVYAQEGDRRSIQWSQVDAGREHVVAWNAEGYAGSITATNYNDGAQACWDDDLQNETCPNP